MNMLAYFLGRLAGGGAGGTSYKSITYNNDDTITLIGTDDTEHTMVCAYEDENLVSVIYDGTEIVIGYDGDKLIVGNTVVDLDGYWYTPTRDEITCTTAGEIMFAGLNDGSNRTVTKTNDGVAVCGYVIRNPYNQYLPCFVGETAEAVQGSNLRQKPTAFVYTGNGKTYYYSCGEVIKSNVDLSKSWCIGAHTDAEAAETGYYSTSKYACTEKAANRLLDYYYHKIDE